MKDNFSSFGINTITVYANRDATLSDSELLNLSDLEKIEPEIEQGQAANNFVYSLDGTYRKISVNGQKTLSLPWLPSPREIPRSPT